MSEGFELSLYNKIMVLTILLFTLYAFDYVGLSLNTDLISHPGMYMIMAFLDTLIVTYVILNSDDYGLDLILRIFLAFFALKYFLVGLEFSYQTNVSSWLLINRLFINGGFVSLIYSVMVVIILGKFKNSDNHKKNDKSFKDHLNFTEFVTIFGKFMLAGGVWILLYILSGAFVFKNIALLLNLNTTLLYINEFGQKPILFLVFFQFLRGIFWTFLLLPILYVIKGGLAKKAITTGLLFSILMASNLLIFNQLPFYIQTAHFIEVFFSNFIFGILLVLIFFFKPKN
ncbi:MAG: hypothetical protein QME14_08455 [Methanobacteriaceae archaeon]|nr:hypothetical protein [Methanobacteriaceae archaeon]